MKYTARTWNLQLDGLSAEQLEQHYKLYQGYVTNTNVLNENIAALAAKGEGKTPAAWEMRRRLGFEYNGMRLHEYYFDNLGGHDSLDTSSPLAKKINECWGSFEAWQADFQAAASSRGIGWVVLYEDAETGDLQNFWVSDHENGHPAGFVPVLVMDVWEHAFTVDYKPTERPKYIEAFFKNISWSVVASRYTAPKAVAVG
jgi:superoxide dismutase, Fe-Mn family